MSNVVISSKNAGKLHEEIQRTLTKIPGAANEAFKAAGEKASKRAVKTLKATAPARTGKSAKSWKKTIENGAYIIHSKAPYHARAHLLEHGHKTPTGGRSHAFQYIAPVEEEAIKMFEKEFEENLARELEEITQ